MSADINLLFMSVLLQSKSRNKKKIIICFTSAKKKQKQKQKHWKSLRKLRFEVVIPNYKKGREPHKQTCMGKVTDVSIWCLLENAKYKGKGSSIS